MAERGIYPSNEEGFVQIQEGGQAIDVDPELIVRMEGSEAKRISEMTNRYINIRMQSLVRKIGLNSSSYLCFVWD